MNYLGDFAASSTVRGMWNSNAVAGESITRATNGSLRIYKNNSTTERSSSAGITDTKDFDSLTGVHHYNIDLSDNTDAGFYAAGNDYFVVLSAATIDGKTINAVIGCFSIENRNIKANVTQFGGTNGTFSSGRPEVNTTHLAGTSQTARDIGASVLLSPGTGTGQVSLNSGAVSLHTSQPAVTFTSLTCTGTFTISDGIVVTCSTSNRTGILVTGNGTGHGVHFRSGSGATGEGFICQALSTNGHGFAGYASGSFNGIYGYGGGGTGNGIKGQGGDTSGIGIWATAISGSAMSAVSASGFGFQIVAGASNNSAIKLTPAGSGYGIEGTLQTAVAVSGAVGSVTGNVGGNVVGSVASVTGNVGGNVVGSVASVTGAVGSVTGNVGGNVTGSVGSVVGAVGSVTGNVGGNVTGSVGSVATGGIAAASFASGAITAAAIATDAIDADALATDAVTEIINAVKAFEVETGVSFLQAMRAISAMLAGTVSGGGTGTETFKSIGGSTTRVTATADSSGNRSAMTLNL